ncbi:MAG: YbhB/YbcL family Raf kinase inhibitor-like protein [Propionibacteriaceae bacterium]|jgi:Raf kinase inhibitor-like YbhB/YbcL family protein|nr:YbhB/YbcL family Raf kinase inhibitor-like protein [Propionibacteriaceae bacterium]
MQLSSTSFQPNGTIPLKHAEPGAGGQNVSPALSWSGAPQGAASFMVVCHDPDAPTGSGWWHWVMTDVPAAVSSLPEGGPLPEGARAWPTDYGYAGWGGMWPPPGPAHHYNFTVFALDVDRLDVPDDATSANVRLAASFHVLDQASVTGLFGQPV